jgi:hypothetical protein
VDDGVDDDASDDDGMMTVLTNRACGDHDDGRDGMLPIMTC